MNKIIFDTETAGLPKNWEASEDDTNSWPRVVEIAWMIIDKDNNIISTKEFIIKPDNFLIPLEASNIHGITTERAHLEGLNIIKVLAEFAEDLSESDLVIAHNIDFDFPVINCEFKRIKMKNKLHRIERFCTMKSTTEFCKIPGKFGNKWPTLTELHYKLFETNFVNSHRALSDVYACGKCYLELKKRGII